MDGARPKLNPKLELKMLEKSQERGQKGVSWEGAGNPAVGKFREVHPGSLAFQIQLGEQPKVGRPFSPQGWGALRPQLVTQTLCSPSTGYRSLWLSPCPLAWRALGDGVELPREGSPPCASMGCSPPSLSPAAAKLPPATLVTSNTHGFFLRVITRLSPLSPFLLRKFRVCEASDRRWGQPGSARLPLWDPSARCLRPRASGLRQSAAQCGFVVFVPTPPPQPPATDPSTPAPGSAKPRFHLRRPLPQSVDCDSGEGLLL